MERTPHEKVPVADIPEPEVGKWRQITHPQKTPDECMGWFMSIHQDGRSTAEIRKTDKGYEVWARRKA